MDIQKIKLAIKQAQKVCNEMNESANKFILQDSINEMNEAMEENSLELSEFEFRCSKCSTVHKKTPYAIAQSAMGNALVFTCECSNRIDV